MVSRLSRGIKEKVGLDVLKSGVLFLKGFEEVCLARTEKIKAVTCQKLA